MMTVGITGGIGSGKSVVCKVFELLNVPVYDADASARRLTDTDLSLKKAIIDLFGVQAYTEDGLLNRKEIASRVFSNPGLLEKLNALIHPAVAIDFSQWKQQHSAAPYVLKEAAILFESGSWKDCRKVILVDAPEDIRIRRVIHRDHRTEEDVRHIISRQWTTEEKRKRSDYYIDNDNTTLIIPQILAIHRSLNSPLQ